MSAATPIGQAVLLVGGAGARLGERTAATPKPLLPVGDRPFVEYWLSALSDAGMGDIVLSCGYLASRFVEAYDRRRWGEATVRCVVESEPAGTGGALSVLCPHLAPRFFLINGDSFLNPDWAALSRRLGDDKSRRMGVLTLASAAAGERYGSVVCDEEGKVLRFSEKPSQSVGSLVNAGVYAFHSAIAKQVRFGDSLERDVLPALARQGVLAGVDYAGPFIDIGVPEDYHRSQTLLPLMAAEGRRFNRA